MCHGEWDNLHQCEMGIILAPSFLRTPDSALEGLVGPVPPTPTKGTMLGLTLLATKYGSAQTLTHWTTSIKLVRAVCVRAYSNLLPQL